jgi:hypothetical protein
MKTKMLLIAAVALAVGDEGGQRVDAQVDILVGPVVSAGKQGTCPGTFSGYANYTLPLPTWGWTPATNTTTFTAANGGGRSDVKIEYMGEYGDSGCDSNSVTIPNPPLSPCYEFTIYFESNPPTTNYPIILTGFNSTN